MARFGSMLTDIGIAAFANAVILEGKVDIAKFGVGDGGGSYYMPVTSMTALKKECWRGNIASSEIDEISPNVIKITAILPSSVGGFTMREVGLFSTDNKLLAIGNMPDTEKIIITEGAAAEVIITMQIAVSNVDVVNITVDPTVIIATKADIIKHNTSALVHEDIRVSIAALKAAKAEKTDVAASFTATNEAVATNIAAIAAIPSTPLVMTAPITAGGAQDLATKQVRNVTISPSDPSGGSNGDMWFKYS